MQSCYTKNSMSLSSTRLCSHRAATTRQPACSTGVRRMHHDSVLRQTSNRQYDIIQPCGLRRNTPHWRLQAADDEVFQPTEPASLNLPNMPLEQMDGNQLQTALAAAIASEDYQLASKIRDVIKASADSEITLLDWRALGIPDWLTDRAERLGFKFPTEVQRRSTPVILSGSDAVVQSATGSGKTFSFLIPALARLDYPPEVYPDDLKGPQLVVVTPSRELGVQIALLVYRLFGGTINAGQPGDVANMYTYFGPRGIKVKGVLDKEEVVMAKCTPYLRHAHVVVATPDALAEVLAEPSPLPLMDYTKVVVVDEVDDCLGRNKEAMELLLSAACSPQREDGERPQMVMVGATVEWSQVEDAVGKGWLQDPVEVVVGGQQSRMPGGLRHRYLVCPQQRQLAVLARMLREDLREAEADGGAPAGPAAGSVGGADRGLDAGVLRRTEAGGFEGLDVGMRDDGLEDVGPASAPTRVIVFMAGEEAVRAAAEGLRAALWTDHRLSVLLPRGAEPIKALHAFRDNQTSLLLCTPQASRGLDLPAVSHVYNIGVPESTTQYLHRAGRAGRIGSMSGGIVTTIVGSEEEAEQLLAVGRELGVEMVEVQEPQAPQIQADVPEADLESAKKSLEDLFRLM